jgi:hypothetical protein
MAKIAPAMPPPTGIFDRLICGRDVSSRMLAPPDHMVSRIQAGSLASCACQSVNCRVFLKLLSLLALWGGPPGPQPTPSSARWDWMKLISFQTRGTRADQGGLRGNQCRHQHYLC